MTTFFIPGLEADSGAAERVYDDLRADAEVRTGSVAHKRRILRVACRRQGTDCTIGVGDAAAIEGGTVIAIFQLGRDGYVIHCRDPEDESLVSAVEISRRTVYAVTDFD